MQGVGMSFLATSMFSLSASYFSANRVAALGIVNVCFGIGSFIGPWSIGNIRASSGSWETPMLVFGFVGIAIAIAIALTVRPWFSETKIAAKHLEDTGGAESLNNHNTIIFAVLSALYGVTIYGFLGLYPTFMVDVLNLEHSDVGGIMKFFGLGSLLAFFGGKLGDRYPTKVILSSSSMVLVVLGYFLYQPDLSMGMYKLMAFLVGVFGASIVYTNLAGGHIKSLRRALTSKGSSMFVSSIYGGAALGGFLMGELISNFGWETAGLIQISLLSLISAILVLWVRPGEFSK
jgi:predicted MFS family arabinose efflux permease